MTIKVAIMAMAVSAATSFVLTTKAAKKMIFKLLRSMISVMPNQMRI